MNQRTKMIMGIALVLGITSIALLAAPIQAYVNGTANGDLLHTQDRDRDKDRLRTHDCDYDCQHIQYRHRHKTSEWSKNGICNCTQSMEQYREQNTERTRSLSN
ncbi:MAG: hypothetical protein JSV29_04680 [Candidatus Bathyarchaeota archaeon]|nr:MAG: hypothetical protein JSV29_04680 [Candidatus Bathyarchaeota archaeon]